MAYLNSAIPVHTVQLTQADTGLGKVMLATGYLKLFTQPHLEMLMGYILSFQVILQTTRRLGFT
jgi:hypothetical protein